MLVTVFDREGLNGQEDMLTRAERRCLAKARLGAGTASGMDRGASGRPPDALSPAR